MFERETRREKILEARNKELRLKEKTKVSFLSFLQKSLNTEHAHTLYTFPRAYWVLAEVVENQSPEVCNH